MLIFKCDKCNKEINEFGGLLICPPATLKDGSCGKIVGKLHVCRQCWDDLLTWMNIPPFAV